MTTIVRRSFWMERAVTIMLSGLAGAALLMSLVGVYGVINYSVSQRTHELGVRMALGAPPSRIRRLVVIQGLRLALLGLLFGLPGAFAVSKLLSALVYGLNSFDPIAFFSVSFLLLGVVLCASYLPARRATKLDPMDALRYE